MKYFTDNNVEVTERIKKGKTIMISGTDRISELQAEATAKEMNSYTYEVFEDIKGKRIHVGYCIPK